MDQIELISLARQGDSDAFYHLICQHKEQLYKIAYSYFRNEQDALEAIQEVTFRAFNHLHKLKQIQYFKTWLLRILINYCIDENKRKKKFTVLQSDEDIYENEDLDNKAAVSLAISKLNATYKSVVILKYFEDLTIVEVADVMAKPTGTIKTWLNKALKELKQLLREEEIEHAITGRKDPVRIEN